MLNGMRVGYLDGWRGLAIVTVLLGHFVLDDPVNLGRFGVELFFVLSGRLMAEILFVRDTPLPAFFERRLARIYPALFVFASAMFAAGILRHSQPTTAQFLAAVTLTANYAQHYTGRTVLLDHIWSLCIEEHVYLILGALAWFHRRRPIPVAAIVVGLAAIAMANGAVRTAAGGEYYAVYWRTDVRGASILAGAGLHLLLRERQGQARVRGWLSPALACAAIGLNVNGVPDPIKYSAGSICLALSLVLLPLAPPAALRLIDHPLLRRAGLWSYSIYLWQQPFYGLGGGSPYHVLLLPLGIVAGILSFYCVEQPLRTWLNRRAHTQRSAIAA